MQDYAKNLSKNIYEFRKRLGLTQEELAKKVGVSYQAVSKWELGVSCPDIATLPVLAEVFNVSVDELIGKERIIDAESTPHVESDNKEEKAGEEGSSSTNNQSSDLGTDIKNAMNKIAATIKTKIADPLKESASDIMRDVKSRKADVKDEKEINLDEVLVDDDNYRVIVFKGKKAIANAKGGAPHLTFKEGVVGDVFIHGDASFDDIKIQGSVNIEGNLKCDDISCVNSAINGNANCDEVKCDKLAIGGSLEADNISVHHFSVGGSVSADSIVTGSDDE